MTEVVKNSNAPFDIAVNEIVRQPPFQGVAGKVVYRLKATLKKDAAPGPIKQELILKTTDPTTPTLTLLVEGNVQATLSVAPGVVNMGKIQAGMEKTMRVQVRGAKQFRILGVDGAGDGVKVEVPTAVAASHLLTIRFATSQVGEVRRQLLIRTDLDNAVLTLPLEATVSP